jgi:DHA2 family multidrug resistance protein
MITLTVMVASILQALDNTIANVALPRMQGSLSATQDQMTWVLTSYIVAAAITTPLTGWLADRFGRKPLFLASIIGFTLASALCGMAQSLDQIVLFRLLQGACGAALIPMSQAVLFDVYPPAAARPGDGDLGHGRGAGSDARAAARRLAHRQLQLALGVLHQRALRHPRRARRHGLFPRHDAREEALRFLRLRAAEHRHRRAAAAAGSRADQGLVQLRRDQARERHRGLAFYLFVAHTLTAKKPFIRLALYRDRNFLTGNILIFLVGIVLFATLALLPPLLQGLMGYSVFQAGVVMVPRGVGTLVAMMLVGRAVGRIDVRLIIGVGLLLTAFSLWQMTHLSMQ